MRVIVYTADTSRCGHRLIWPVEALVGEGADIGIIRKDRAGDVAGEIARGADVIVMQRPMLRRFVEAIPRVQAQGIAVVVDIDDDFTALHRGNAVWERVHPTIGVAPGELGSQYLREACRLADLVTVTTPRLVDAYAGHGRAWIVPNHVPASYLDVERVPLSDRPVAGWTGSVATHPGDLQVTRGGVARAVETVGAGFHVVGPADGVRERLGLAEEPTSTGWVGLDDYPAAMAQIDVGVVPLQSSAFNEAKSWLKMMEFAALGVPVVGSPTGPNVEFAARHGLALARKPKDWTRHVRELLVSAEMRADVGGRARESMRSETIEGNAHLWWEAWEQASQRARRRVPA